ncbi:lysophospholipid acyltransferase family protein [uncultured Prevotella sp.]|uniref:lysophospholipid acyltransferase family protein n=1 Tax=uncultured Prevotella sp. TaxID=159272 RepID=UPI0025D3DB70|nr:lysophospholipid acyltransferase family protein [uncultured Prevotella sp.]
MKYLYNTYQLLIALPLIVIETVIICSCIIVGAALGFGHFWANYPPRLWARIILWLLFIPVKVEGRDRLDPKESYVFVANHQGAFDIFLIYGHLNRNFKWMMKYQLRKIPFVGFACAKTHQIFVDKRGPKKIKATYDLARETLQDGTSVTVFPEGSRSYTGHMGVFKKGAFMLADELQLPVVPLTINGSFNIMPRTRDMKFARWHRLTLTIHDPIYPVGKGPDNVEATKNQAYDSVMSALVPEYQGFVENPDQ